MLRRPAVLVMLLTFTQAATAFSLLEWLGFGDDKTEAAAGPAPQPAGKTANWAESNGAVAGNEEMATNAAPDNSGQVRFQDIKLIVANLNEQQRNRLLADEEAFSKFIQQQAANESVLVAARANKLDQDPFTRLLMQKSADNTLRELYIKRLINKELSPDFPSEEQARNFYENNRDQFSLEERVHVWQIFLPFGQDADGKTKEALKKQAHTMKKDIDAGKTTFTDAATEHSRHVPSRHTGGYMGLIKLSDIKPEIRETVLKLKEDQLSEPVLTDDGYHLIRRGSRIAASTLPFEQVKAQINQALRKEAENRLRRAIFEKASETYDRRLDGKRIEEWRLKLRTNL